MGKIKITLGSESHTTSSQWTKASINGKAVSHRDAEAKKWLTSFGDKHASWCECVFSVSGGDTISIESGKNSGNRGSKRVRTEKTFRFDESAEVKNIELAASFIEGRLVEVSDEIANAKSDYDSIEL